MVRVVPALAVALGPELLDEDVGPPALEAAGAGFEALDCGGAGSEGLFGVPDCEVEVFVGGGPDCAWCEVWFAGEEL